MNILLILLLNFSLVINIFNCTGKISPGNNDPLPGSRPEKLVIEYRLDGGMMYYSEALYISEDSSYYTVNDGGAISRVNFKLNAKELDEIYKVFAGNSFDRIKTYEEKVYDRGGNSIYLRWGKGKFASVSNSGMSFVDNGWREEWNNCMKALEKIMTGQAELQKKDYLLGFDKTLFGKELNIYINDEQIISKSVLNTEHKFEESISKTVKLIPGKHRLSISWDKHYDNIQIDADSSKGIFLFIINDTLKHKYIY